jgi:DNA-binding transcriptional LysR family regulator
VEQYPNLSIRLRGTPARLEDMLRAVPRDILVRKLRDRWSAQEHAGHLLDLEPLWIARVHDFLADGDTLSVADLSNRKTYEANHNSRELIQIFADFRAARLRLLDRIGKFGPVLFARSMLHPRLKQPMRLVDHLYFVAEHDDHHLARIWEIINPNFLEH